MSTTKPAPTVRSAESAERRWFFGGGVHTWLATKDETNGAFLLFEDAMGRGKMTPLHSHPDSDETMYVLEGEILVHVDGAEHRLATGGCVVCPRGVPHAFMVLTDVARVLCLHTPGGGQSFYWGASRPMSSDGADVGEVDFDRVHASARDNGGIEMLGPPPFARP